MTSPHNEQAIIEALEHRIALAHVTLDMSVFEELLHCDYLIVQPDGTIEDKETVLSSYRSGGRQWDSAGVQDLDVRISGHVAIVVGTWKATGRNEDDSFDYSARFLSVWTKNDGPWRNIAYQSTDIASL